jgi:hypothetical protein
MFGIVKKPAKRARRIVAERREHTWMQVRRSGKDRRTGGERRKAKAPAPGDKDRRAGDDPRKGKDRRGGSA